jgi:hypothetical protein
MCIAIFKPRKTQPDWSSYKKAFKANPDGWGFAVAKDNKLIIKKGVTSFNNFKKKFQPYRAYPALVHFRIRTSGEIDDKNCHPFSVTEDLCCIHNGMLDIQCSINKKMSDTWHFVTQVLRPMCEGDDSFPWNQGSSFLGEHFLGHGNKMVFLKNTGEHTVWNYDLGHVSPDKHWYSNYSYTSYSRFTGMPKKQTSTSNNWLYNNSGKSYYSWSDKYSADNTTASNNYIEIDEEIRKEEYKRLWEENDEKFYDPLPSLDESDTQRLTVEADDPFSGLNDLGESDYNAAQGLAAAGLSAYTIECLHDFDNEALELLWSNYCDKTEYLPEEGADIAQH